MIANAKLLFALFGITSFASLASCANVLGIEETKLQTSTVPDTGPVKGKDWACLGKVQPDPIGTPGAPDSGVNVGQDGGPPSVTITVAVLGLATLKPPASKISIKACANPTDPNCTEVVTETETDAKGNATIELPIVGNQGFSGYFYVTGDGYIPFLWYFSRPLVKSRAFPLLVITDGDVQAGGKISNELGVESKPDRGYLAVNVTDCQDVDAPNVVIDSPAVKNDSLVVPFYLRPAPGGAGVFLSSTGTETDGIGVGGYWNLKPGVIEISSLSKDVNKVTARTSLLIRPGSLTTIRLLPQ